MEEAEDGFSFECSGEELDVDENLDCFLGDIVLTAEGTFAGTTALCLGGFRMSCGMFDFDPARLLALSL